MWMRAWHIACTATNHQRGVFFRRRSATLRSYSPLRRCHSTGTDAALGAVQRLLEATQKSTGTSNVVRFCVSSSGEATVELPPAMAGSALRPRSAVVLARQNIHDAASLGDLLARLEQSLTQSAFPAQEVQKDMTPVLLDAARRGEYMSAAREMLHGRYPGLRLHVEHSSGADLQGCVTHTAEVSLRKLPHCQVLSTSEQHALHSFVGSAVGEGYHSVHRRALAEAFGCVGIDFSAAQRTARSRSATSVLALYVDALKQLCNGSCTVDVQSDHDSTVAIGIRSNNDAEVYRVNGEKRFSLTLLLAACKGACVQLDSGVADQVARAESSHPVFVVLPETNIRVKRVMRHLMAHYYGINEEDVEFGVESLQSGVVRSNARVTVRLTSMGVSKDDLVCDIGHATGTSAKAAAQLATVKILQELFPRIYSEQIAHHPEVKAILVSSKSWLSDRERAPPATVGIAPQLLWVLKQKDLQYHLTSTQLYPHQSKGRLGVVASAPTWVTNIRVVSIEANDPNHSHYVCTTFHKKKSKSELKAVACALASFASDICADGVQWAVSQGLINDAGEPTPCSTVMLESASALSNLTGTDGNGKDAEGVDGGGIGTTSGVSMSPRTELTSTTPERRASSLLEGYRRRFAGYAASVSVHYGCALKPHEEVTHNAKDREHTAALRLVPDDLNQSSTMSNALPTHLGTASHRCKARALMASYELFNQRHFRVPRDGVSVDSNTEMDSVEDAIAATLLRLPNHMPADNILDVIASALLDLYGMSVTMHTSLERNVYIVELRGTPARQPGDEGVTDDGGSNAANTKADEVTTESYVFARGEAVTHAAAVARCCRRAYDAHILPAGSGFGPSKRVSEGTLRLQMGAKPSVLGGLIKVVVDEINSLGKGDHTGQLHVSLTTPTYTVALVVTSRTTGVSVEQACGPNPVAALRELRRAICAETNTPFDERISLGPPTHTNLQLLRALCAGEFGLTVFDECVFVGREWHCRLCIALGPLLESDTNICYCLCTSAATRKKDAVEGAAASALQAYFGRDAVSNVSGVRAISGSYAFQLDTEL